LDFDNKALPWYALRVRGRHEKTTAALLQDKGYENFLPLYTSARRWSDRIKEIEFPLFPGYLFCRFGLHDRVPILKTLGVLSIVGIGTTPTPVDSGEIAAIQSVIQSRLPVEPWPFLHIGQRVHIDSGSLCGLQGIVVHFKSQARLVVSITLLQRSVAVEIDSARVSAALRAGHSLPGPNLGSSATRLPL
jgi:transcription antitermination factor NusG